MEGAVSELGPDDTTRRRVIQAAVECILERGFYRASSNEIARRAGMTWGAIQYYFGTRERLMLAALQLADERMERLLDPAAVKGDTTEERLVQLTRLLVEQYGKPEYLASLQIVLNLAHNPETSYETAQALVASNSRLSQQVQDLITAAVGRKPDPATLGLIFNACRGVALSNLVTTETTPRQLASERRPGRIEADMHGIAKALALFIDAQVPDDSAPATRKPPRKLAKSAKR